jgi:hypothetical protein
MKSDGKDGVSPPEAGKRWIFNPSIPIPISIPNISIPLAMDSATSQEDLARNSETRLMRFHDVESRAREEAEAKALAEAKAAERKRKMDAFYEKLYISESSDDEELIEIMAPAIAVKAVEDAEEEANNVAKKHHKMVDSPFFR